MLEIPDNDVECPGLYVLDADDAGDLRHGPGQHGPEHRGVGAQRPGADLNPLSEWLLSNLRKLGTVLSEPDVQNGDCIQEM